MSITIGFVQSDAERDDMWQARYRVFVDTDHYLPPNADRRILDRFDTYPTTRNIIALDTGRVIGGVRMTEQSAASIPPSEMFDFTSDAPRSGRYGGGSWFFLDETFRTRSRIAAQMMTMAYAWAIARGWTHVVGVVNPPVLDGFLRSGYRQLRETLHDPHKNLPFVPVILDLAHLPADMRAMAETIITERTVHAQDAVFVFAPDPP